VKSVDKLLFLPELLIWGSLSANGKCIWPLTNAMVPPAGDSSSKVPAEMEVSGWRLRFSMSYIQIMHA